jgi:putative flippase GtrA
MSAGAPAAPSPLSLIKRAAASLLHRDREDSLEGQAVRQAASGAAATLIDIGLFKLALGLSAHALPAALISTSAGGAVNFVLSRHYVFGRIERQRRPLAAQILLYVPAVLVAVALNQLILAILCLWLGLPPMPVKILAATPLVFLWTLFSGRCLIFARRPASEGKEPRS